MYIDRINALIASDILSWKYDEPYDFYNNEFSPEAVNEMLKDSYLGVFDTEKRLVGFFCLGSAAQVPNDKYTYSKQYIDIGIGMRPEYTGQGNGFSFLAFVLSYINKTYGNTPKRLTVAKFNLRAIRLYEKFSFHRESEFVKGTIEFVTMIQENDSFSEPD
ncbi:hypothetical protein D3C75_617410 [compost metagenome]